MDYNEIGVSVLIPIYNGIEFLEESLTSVIQQHHTKWEVIIGINGHPKDSDVEKKANKIRNFFDKRYNIKVMYYDVKGKSKVLNLMVNDCNYSF